MADHFAAHDSIQGYRFSRKKQQHEINQAVKF